MSPLVHSYQAISLVNFLNSEKYSPVSDFTILYLITYTFNFLFLSDIPFPQDLPYFSKKAMKTEFNRKRKASMVEDYVDDDDESRDWWTKYFASVEATIEVRIIFLENLN